MNIHIYIFIINIVVVVVIFFVLFIEIKTTCPKPWYKALVYSHLNISVGGMLTRHTMYFNQTDTWQQGRRKWLWTERVLGDQPLCIPNINFIGKIRAGEVALVCHALSVTIGARFFLYIYQYIYVYMCVCIYLIVIDDAEVDVVLLM